MSHLNDKYHEKAFCLDPIVVTKNCLERSNVQSQVWYHSAIQVVIEGLVNHDLNQRICKVPTTNVHMFKWQHCKGMTYTSNFYIKTLFLVTNM